VATLPWCRSGRSARSGARSASARQNEDDGRIPAPSVKAYLRVHGRLARRRHVLNFENKTAEPELNIFARLRASTARTVPPSLDACPSCSAAQANTFAQHDLMMTMSSCMTDRAWAALFCACRFCYNVGGLEGHMKRCFGLCVLGLVLLSSQSSPAQNLQLRTHGFGRAPCSVWSEARANRNGAIDPRVTQGHE
jgi:hypothetical protein